MIRLTILLAGCVATACAVAPDDVDVSVAYKPGNGGDGDPCPPNECGGNSPVVSGVYFSSLHALGQANAENVRITGVLAPDGVTPMILLAVGDRLEGVTLPFFTRVSTAALINTTIFIDVDGAPGRIRIGGVRREPFWVSPRAIETYDFYYVPLDGTEVESPLCSQALQGDSSMISALVFEGDLYDHEKVVHVGPTTAYWFTIACVDSAPYKMHKIGYTGAAQARLGYVTSVDQRQAMLRAWTSTTCDTGTAFTESGVPLVVRQSATPLPPDSPYMRPIEHVEAIWGPEGALCLSKHRLDMEDEIEQECGPKPECTQELIDAFELGQYGHVLTGLP